MTRSARSPHWRSHLRRLLATVAVTALAAVGLVAGAAPAQAAPVLTNPNVGVSCYFNFLRIESGGTATLSAGDTIEASLVVDSEVYKTVTETATADNSGYPLSLGGPWFDDDNDHTAAMVVNGETVASGTFSYLTSCDPKPVPATVSFGAPVCTDSTATAPIDIAHEQGVSPEFTVTTESADGTKSYTRSSQDQMGQVHFDISLARTGTTTVTVTERYRPTLTTPVDEHTYTLPEDCNLPTPTSTPTPEPTSTPTATPTDAPSPSPSESAAPLTVSLSTNTVSRGSQVAVTSNGFAPGETVQIWLHSTPVKLATTAADDTGAVRQTVTIPEGTEIGAHKIEVRGATSGSAYANLTITDGLAVTGFDSVASTVGGGVGALLLAAGLGVVFLVRRRRVHQQ